MLMPAATCCFAFFSPVQWLRKQYFPRHLGKARAQHANTRQRTVNHSLHRRDIAHVGDIAFVQQYDVGAGGLVDGELGRSEIELKKAGSVNDAENRIEFYALFELSLEKGIDNRQWPRYAAGFNNYMIDAWPLRRQQPLRSRHEIVPDRA